MPSTGVPEGLERLLACLQKATGHELPNELVAMQGLVQLVQMEEGDHLGPESKDYLRRLVSRLRQTLELVRALAEAVRLGRQHLPPECVDPGEVAEEVAAELKQLSPDLVIESEPLHRVPALAVPRESLRLVLVRVLRHVLATAPPAKIKCVGLSGTTLPHGVELRITAPGQLNSTVPLAQLFEPFATEKDTRLDLFLARQRVLDWGGTIHAEDLGGGDRLFVITVPSAVRETPALGKDGECHNKDNR